MGWVDRVPGVVRKTLSLTLIFNVSEETCGQQLYDPT